MNPLAITGVGVLGPLGVGKDVWFSELAQGASLPETPSTVLDVVKFPNARVIEAKNVEVNAHLGDKGHRNFDRLTKFLIIAAKLALENANIKSKGQFIALSPEQVGVCSSTAYGSLEAITELQLVTETEDPRYLNPARFPNTVINAAAGYVSIWEDLRAPNVTVVNGNCASLDAVLTSSTHLEHKRADVFLVGGGEVLSEALYLAFVKLGVLAEGTMQWNPGGFRSEGTHIGEGAAFLCVERPHDAKARSATIQGRIVGYGTSFEAPESEALLVHASEKSIARSIEKALEDAGREPSDVDLVCSSVSGLERMDAAELSALKRVFSDKVAVAAPKSFLGETFGVAGALGMICALGWMKNASHIPLVSGKLPSKVNTVVVTTVGYYGNASAVVLTSEG